VNLGNGLSTITGYQNRNQPRKICIGRLFTTGSTKVFNLSM